MDSTSYLTTVASDDARWMLDRLDGLRVCIGQLQRHADGLEGLSTLADLVAAFGQSEQFERQCATRIPSPPAGWEVESASSVVARLRNEQTQASANLRQLLHLFVGTTTPGTMARDYVLSRASKFVEFWTEHIELRNGISAAWSTQALMSRLTSIAG